MAYTPKEWECGEVVTAEALNHIEQGIANAGEGGGGGSLLIKIASFEDDSGTGYRTITFDKTWQEVYDAFTDGTPCFVAFPNVSSLCDLIAEDLEDPIAYMYPVFYVSRTDSTPSRAGQSYTVKSFVFNSGGSTIRDCTTDLSAGGSADNYFELELQCSQGEDS